MRTVTYTSFFQFRRPAQAVQAGLLAALITILTGAWHASPYNNYILLAKAFLENHVWIDWPGPYIDALAYNGLHYVIEGPVPALLAMPFVALFGIGCSQSLLGAGLAGVAIGAAWLLFERLALDFASRVWLTVFFFAGTDLWWCATLGDVWFVAHLGAVACTMLALCELAGARRPVLVALWAAMAAGCRFSMLVAIPVYALMLLETHGIAVRETSPQPLLPKLDAQQIRRPLVPFLAMLGIWFAAWLRYNEARWQVPYDIGYTAWYHLDAAGNPDGSPFGLRYFWYQVQSFFWSWPERLDQAPWLRAQITGQGLPFTSPALVLALRAPLRSHAVRNLWLLTLLTAIPAFLYYVNGFAQFGMRHALDFEPFLLVLIALGIRRGMPIWGRVLCAYSALTGVWGVWYWHAVMGR